MTLGPFVNEPVLELRRGEVRDALSRGMAALERKLPLHVPAMIGQQRIEGETLLSTDPGDPERIVAVAPRATGAEARRAVEAASAAAGAWASVAAEERAHVL